MSFFNIVFRNPYWFARFDVKSDCQATSYLERQPVPAGAVVTTIASVMPSEKSDTTSANASQAIRGGFVIVGFSVVGILAAADVIFILLARAGVTVAVSFFPVVWSAMRGASAAHLINLGLRIIAANVRGFGARPDTVAPQPTAMDHANEPTTQTRMVLLAFLLHVSNVKAALMPSMANGIETVEFESKRADLDRSTQIYFGGRRRYER